MLQICVCCITLGFKKCCYKFQMSSDKFTEPCDELFQLELVDGRASFSLYIEEDLHRMNCNRQTITFFVDFYLKKLETDWRKRLEDLTQKVPLMEECLVRVLKKERAEQEAMRVLDKSWGEMTDVTTLIHKAITAHQVDKDDDKFFGAMRGM